MLNCDELSELPEPEIIQMKKELEMIKKIILDVAGKHGIGIEKIIISGSRARGDCKEGSDRDMLIVTKEKLNIDEFWKFYSCLNGELISGLKPCCSDKIQCTLRQRNVTGRGKRSVRACGKGKGVRAGKA